MKCCGETRLTPFCPMCGIAVSGGVPKSLLKHIQTHERLYLRHLKDAISQGSRHVESTRKNHEKWKSWLDFVVQAIVPSEETSDA